METNTFRAEYEDRGIAVVDTPVIDAEIVDAACNAAYLVRDGTYETGVEPISRNACDEGQLCKIDNAHLSNRTLYALLTESDLGMTAARVVGAHRVQIWATQLLIKPSTKDREANVGWHQDRQYWSYWDRPDGLFTCWIALSDVGIHSGPVQFVKGSHRWGFLNQGDFFGTDQDSLKAAIPVPDRETWEEVPALLSPGAMSVHHALTYHGSGPNTSGTDRISVAVHMRTETPQPVTGNSEYYVAHLDDPAYCPVIYDDRARVDR